MIADDNRRRDSLGIRILVQITGRVVIWAREEVGEETLEEVGAVEVGNYNRETSVTHA